MFALARAAVVICTLVFAGGGKVRAQVEVDVKLVLAVDISMSMDPDEQRLQREGYVEAFRDPNVINAIRGGQRRRIAVTYVEWAGPQIQTVLVPWRLIDSETSAKSFAAYLLSQPYSRRSRTSISSALLFAQSLLATTDFRSPRRVIDVSGDGVNNSGPLMSAARTQVLADGIVINGLPILIKPTLAWSAWDAPHLDLYYGNCVIGGPGSFMIPIEKSEAFATATRQKLLLEIASVTSLPRFIRVQQERPSTYDCGEVERRIERRQWEN